jgi:hypothetical protein
MVFDVLELGEEVVDRPALPRAPEKESGRVNG